MGIGMNVLWMVIAGTLFACMGACVKLAAASFGLGHTVLARGIVPSVLIGTWILAQGQKLATPHWRSHLYRSVSGSAGMLMYFTAIPHLPLATAVTLNNTSALFIALILSLRGRPPIAALIALCTGFCGVAMVLRPTINESQWHWGLIGLASGFLACVAQLNLRELGKAGEPEWRTVFIFSCTCSLFALPFAAVAPSSSSPPQALAWMALIAIGLLGGIAQLALTRAFRTGKTLVNASLSYLTVVFSALLGIPLWGDTLSPIAWLGIVVIIAASIVSSHPATWAEKRAR